MWPRKALPSGWHIQPPSEYLLGRAKILQKKNTVFLSLNCTHLACKQIIMVQYFMWLNNSAVSPMAHWAHVEEALCNCKGILLHLGFESS